MICLSEVGIQYVVSEELLEIVTMKVLHQFHQFLVRDALIEEALAVGSHKISRTKLAREATLLDRSGTRKVFFWKLRFITHRVFYMLIGKHLFRRVLTACFTSWCSLT